MIDKKPVSQTLRKMKINDVVEFSIKQLTSIRITVNRIKLMEDLRFTTQTMNSSVFVTRVK